MIFERRSMEREINVKCPYCGNAAKIQVRNDYEELRADYCHYCGGVYVTQISVVLDSDVFPVEGERERIAFALDGQA